MIYSLAKNLKKIRPDLKILCGGPEVSYGCSEILEKNPAIDMILYGEGEKTFGQVITALIDNRPLDKVDGICFRVKGHITTTPPRKPLTMDTLPFVYDNLSDLNNRIIYYETQRGCPYNCQFCLSSVEKGVRFLSLDKVYTQLDFFLKNKVRQVKFVDRTFNCNKTHAESIWQYLIEKDNGVTNFHMEIEAHILADDTLELLKQAREGLFQFEIGVQSTNRDTLTAVKRNPDFPALRERIEKIQALGNIHIHLDLIAGLPGEGYESFGQSFNDVYALHPHQLQLGFLKLLTGSGLKENAQTYGLVSRDEAPYEILYTNDLTYRQMCQLKTVENMVETYYNSAKALNSVRYFALFFPSPFRFYETLGQYWEENGYHRVSHNKEHLYTVLYEFAQTQPELKDHLAEVKDLLKFDMLAFDNLNQLPSWLTDSKNMEDEKQIRRQFFNNKAQTDKYLPLLCDYSPSQLNRMCRLEPFQFNVLEDCEKKEKNYILFNYYKRDFLTNRAEFQSIE